MTRAICREPGITISVSRVTEMPDAQLPTHAPASPSLTSRSDLIWGVPYGSDGVGLGAVGDLGRSRAVGGVLVDDLSDNSHVLGPGVGANGSSDESNSVLHFVG